MTPTAVELWNDLKFLKKRYQEQVQYMLMYNIRKYNPNGNVERFNEVLRSAQFIKDNFEKRIKELEQ